MYGKLFDANNPFWRGMGRVFDACELNILWLLCCIPIVTIWPATTAFYYAMINLVRGEERYVHKDFFHSFKSSIRKTFPAGLLLMAAGIFLVLDIYIAYKSGTGIYSFFLFFFAVIFLLWCFVALYSFPLLAKFDNSLKNTLIWAFTLSIRNFHLTLLMLFLIVLEFWLCHLLPGLMFILFGLVCEFHSTLFAAILKPWLPKVGWSEEDEPEEDGE